MSDEKGLRRYVVVLLPRREIAARGLSLREAQAWMRAYNQAVYDTRREAVIAEEQPSRKVA